MTRFIGFLFILLQLNLCGAIAGSITDSGSIISESKLFRLNEMAPGVKKSYYSQSILKFLEHWPPPTLALTDERPVIIRAIKTPDRPNYMGMVKHSEINVSLKKVEAITERFEDYSKIWDDILSGKVISFDRNRSVTEWVRKAPAFFLPKVHYRMLYTSDKSFPGRIVYRQQLIDGNMLNFSDSIVVLEKLAEDRTRVTVLNFFDTDFGLLRRVAESKIWKTMLQNGFKDDIAFRAKLEHPDWDVDQITKEANKALDRFPIDEVQYTELLSFK